MIKLQTGAKLFKSIIDVLKDILLDVNISFQEKSVHIRSVDPEKMCILDVVLDKFDNDYVCDSPTIIGVHLPLLYKCLRTVTSTDILQIEVFNENDSKYMKLSISSLTEAQPNLSTTIPSLDIEVDDLSTHPFEVYDYKNLMKVSLKEMKKAVKNMSHLNKKITLSGHSDLFGVQLEASNTLASSIENIKCEWIKQEEIDFSKEFYCRNLDKLLKLCFIQNQLTIKVDTSDNPIVFSIQMENGIITLYIAPIV